MAQVNEQTSQKRKSRGIGGLLLAVAVLAVPISQYYGPVLDYRGAIDSAQSWLNSARAQLLQSRQADSSKVSAQTPPASDAAVIPAEAACKLSGKVADCGCDFASVERMNQQVLNPILSQLVHKPFFRFFKVNLYCDCQFWPDAGMCVQRDCCVAECDASDIPAAWRAHDEALAELAVKHKEACTGEASVDRSVSDDVRGALAAVKGWHGLNNPWVPEDDQGTDYVYVDLTKNSEKYTGYKGEDARRIWAAIYEQPAIKAAGASVSAGGSIASTVEDTEGEAGGVAHEQRVLYRLISGMHASITMSIITNFYHEETGTWGANLPFFKARFGSPASRPHVENLYFALLFVLRAVMKAGPALHQLDLTQGWSHEEGQSTHHLVTQLLDSPAIQAACHTPFDEGVLWRHDPARSEAIRQQLQVTFHNITRLMDCVGCEKCKMHGKLNILGIATALKVLFAQQTPVAAPGQAGAVVQAAAVASTALHPLALDRNEAIALINFLAKLSDSVEGVRALSLQVDGIAR